MMGGFGPNFGGNFAGSATKAKPSTKTVTADLCVVNK